MKHLALILPVLLIFSCAQNETDINSKSPAENRMERSSQKNNWSSRAVPIDDLGWGYQLFEGARMQIFQKNIPAISGLHYFETKEKAEIAAAFALEKIDQGFFPPSVNPEELDSIGAINLDSLLTVNEELKANPSTK